MADECWCGHVKAHHADWAEGLFCLNTGCGCRHYSKTGARSTPQPSTPSPDTRWHLEGCICSECRADSPSPDVPIPDPTWDALRNPESAESRWDWRDDVDAVIGYALVETEHMPGFARRGPAFREKLAEAGWRVEREAALPEPSLNVDRMKPRTRAAKALLGAHRDHPVWTERGALSQMLASIERESALPEPPLDVERLAEQWLRDNDLYAVTHLHEAPPDCAECNVARLRGTGGAPE